MTQTAGPDLKYVYRCLQLNPAKQAEQILDLRAAALGLPTRVQEGGTEAAKKRQARRKKLQQELDSLRGVFWTAPGTQLQLQLNKLDVSDFPELQKSVERMLHLVNMRQQVQGLMGLPHSNSNLLNTIKRVMMLPPIEAGRVKDEYLFTLPFHEALSSVKSMVRMLIDRFPEIYQLERAWFDQILAARAGKRYVARAYSGSSSNSQSPLEGMGYTFFAIIFFLVLIARIVHISTR